MRQGVDFVFVKVSTALTANLGEWSRPVQMRLDYHENGDVELVTRERNDIRDAAELIAETYR